MRYELRCSKCQKVLYRSEQEMNPKRVLADIGVCFPDGTPVPRGHKMMDCGDCFAESICVDLELEALRENQN